MILVIAGCGEPPAQRDAGVDAGPGMDAAPVIPDGTVFCELDEDCDDGVSCTVDSCGPAGTCRNMPEQRMCDDGVFCNGAERCDPAVGCLPPAMRETCNDQEVCTTDRCDEETDACTHTPRDLDLDGDVDFFCAGGGDCDDMDPTVSSMINEICDDLADNDCDGEIDESECGAPPHDTCDDPIDVSGGGFFLLDTTGAVPNYEGSCGGSGRGDLVATFTLTEARSITIEGEGNSTVTLALRSECADFASELGCDSGFPGTLRLRSLEPGTYFLIVASTIGGEIGLDVSFGEPLPPIENETCASPIDVSAGGTFTGSFVGGVDDTTVSCGFSGTADAVYTFTTTEPHDLEVVARSAGESLAWALRSTCDDAGAELRCVYGRPALGRVHQLPAGTYFIVVETSLFEDVDYALDVRFLAPTPPPAGDTCGNPLPLTVGTPLTGTLVDKQDDLDVSCGFSYRDAVHEFTLASASDVTVELDAGGFGNMSIRASCADDRSDLICASGNPSYALLRNLPAGTYYVVAEASRGAGYTLQVEATAPTPFVDVSGNETCASAYDIPPTGGLFHGDTSAMSNDHETSLCGSTAMSPDAAYRLTLTERQRVVLSTLGSSYDTVLHLHRDMCTDGGELGCNDDASTPRVSTSLIDRELDAGTYLIVVDGWGSFSSGEYYLEVTVSDP